MTIPTRKSLPGSVDSFGYSLWSSRRVLRRRNSEPEWSFLFNEEASARGCYCSLLCFPRSLGGGGRERECSWDAPGWAFLEHEGSFHPWYQGFCVKPLLLGRLTFTEKTPLGSRVRRVLSLPYWDRNPR